MNQLSIVVCTYNRAELLSTIICSFDQDVLMPHDFALEVVIVDNNSRDSTKQVVAEAVSKNRDYILTYAFEQESGLSNARNRGIEVAKFERISFLDDDAIPDTGFLLALNSAFHKNPEVSCFVHKVVNHPIKVPDWYRLKGKYRMLNRGNYDLGNTSRFLTQNDPMPIGSGMVISKWIFERLGKFNSSFGYDATQSMWIPGEETEFFSKVMEDGIPVFYVHDASVNHYPDKDKYEVGTLCRIYAGIGYWYGTMDAKAREKKNIITWAGFPRAYYKRFLYVLFPYLVSRCLLNETIKNFYAFEMKRIIGYFRGYH